MNEIALMILTLLVSLNVVRLTVGELATHNTVEKVIRHRSLGEIHNAATLALSITPEDARPFLVLGQSLTAASLASDASGRNALSEMSETALRQSIRLDPAEGAGWLALAMVAAPRNTELATLFAHTAVLRRPGHPENVWVYARSLPPNSEAQAAAYRETTRLDPRLTPKVIAEVAVFATAITDQARYVSPLASCYRFWAWSITSPVEGIATAKIGLRMRSANSEATRLDHGWLDYYIGLKLTEQGRPVEALPWFERAVDAVGDEQAFYRNYGFALLKSGAARRASEEFRKSIQLHPDLSNAAHLGLGQATEAMGNKAAAMSIYRRLAYNPRLEEWVRQEAGGGIYRLENQR